MTQLLIQIYYFRHIIHPVSSSTLGRFSKSTNRLQSTPSFDYDYRSAQTLPRKLEHRPLHSSAINIAIVNQVRSPLAGGTSSSAINHSHLTGPAKPARTYKALNRSKSFNVHGLNGTNDPSPIYLEKLTRNQPHHNMYRSNPHLNEDKTQLRSPSIVNLISRSQRDLTKIDENGSYNNNNTQTYHHRDGRRLNGHQRNGGYTPQYVNGSGTIDRRSNSLLRNGSDSYHHQRAEVDSPIRNVNGGNGYKYGLERNLQRERESSLGSRSPVTINKDTASIVRRGSSSEDYSESYKITSRSDDPHRPSVTNTVHNYSKKSLPIKNGRGTETVESSERKTVTTSRYRDGNTAEPHRSIRYLHENGRNGNGVVIEVRNSPRK